MPPPADSTAMPLLGIPSPIIERSLTAAFVELLQHPAFFEAVAKSLGKAVLLKYADAARLIGLTAEGVGDAVKAGRVPVTHLLGPHNPRVPLNDLISAVTKSRVGARPKKAAAAEPTSAA